MIVVDSAKKTYSKSFQYNFHTFLQVSYLCIAYLQRYTKSCKKCMEIILELENYIFKPHSVQNSYSVTHTHCVNLNETITVPRVSIGIHIRKIVLQAQMKKEKGERTTNECNCCSLKARQCESRDHQSEKTIKEIFGTKCLRVNAFWL